MPFDPDVAPLISHSVDELKQRSLRRGRQLIRRRRVAETGAIALVVVVMAGVLGSLGGDAQRLRTTRPAVRPDRGGNHVGGGAIGSAGSGDAVAGGGGTPVGAVPEALNMSGGHPRRAGRSGAVARGHDRGPGAEPHTFFGRLTFARALDQSSDIYTQNLDGTALTNVTRSDPTGSGWQATDPVFSPDGRRIAYTGVFNAGRTNDPIGTTEFAVFVVNADGSGTRRVSPPRRVGHGYHQPSWFPDSRHIVMWGDATSDDLDLFIVDVDGGGVQDVTNTSQTKEVDPAVSPDGRQILFAILGNSVEEAAVWVMNADGTGRRRIVAGRDPAWSPDGGHIVVTQFDSAGSSHPGTHIVVANADGSQAHRVTTEQDPAVTFQGSFLADGRLVFGRDPDGTMKGVEPDVGVPNPPAGGPDPGVIVIANVDGSGDRQVTTPAPGENDSRPHGV